MIRVTFCSSVTPPLALRKYVEQWLSKSHITFGVILLSVRIGGSIIRSCMTVASLWSEGWEDICRGRLNSREKSESEEIVMDAVFCCL